ncbi:MAG TPA: ubiquitin-like domain-containing protein, partial [Bacillales bacterium]|nr:ubiquitin-like domain-containing protein [Bacillales bacterium]
MSSKFHLTGRGKKWLMTAVSFAVLCAVFGMLAYQLSKKPVTVILDGKKQHVSAHADTVGELLKDLHVKINKHDLVKPGVDAKLQDEMTVRWEPAVQVKMNQNGQEMSTWTTAETVGDLLKSNQIQVGDHDKLYPTKDTPITEGMNISYMAGFQVNLNVGGKHRKVWTTATDSTTVADFLKKQDIKYDDNDQIKPGLTARLSEAERVRVTYNKKVTDVVEQPIDFA